MIEILDQDEIENQIIAGAINKRNEAVERLIERKVIIENQTEKSELLEKELKSILCKLKSIANSASVQEFTFPTISETISNGTISHTVLSKYLIPEETWGKLLEYQKVGVEWLFSIHEKQSGGLLGDEMGLGKTVMVSVFLAGLKASQLFSGPIVILCPATLIDQWQSELHKWAPGFRVCTFRENREKVLKKLFAEPFGILLITYEILHTQYKALHRHKWFYVILDEGHKVRNSTCSLTQLCKRFRNFHRLILSGTPIQNSLNELWSLFDFIVPGLLGNCEVFTREFGFPITKAGYSKANDLEVELAYQCAIQLREIISPYILRRTKKDVSIGIPDHQEKILYCELDMSQWEVYKKYLENMEKDKETLVLIKDLRFICNHPSMLENNLLMRLGVNRESLTSGKLKVLGAILEVWKEEEHSVLIFSQYKKMLDLAEVVVQNCGLSYSRIDGDLEVPKRLPLIDIFNSGGVQVLLLTTKVGGLGINLPKASRVVLLDPDWNPMNDSQAKERALRIGQKKNLIIYRFITKHTIEEKIYNRQIFKMYLANKILQSPNQKKFFKETEIKDLFEVPPMPKDLESFQSEDLPQKRKRENKMIEMVLACEVKKYEENEAFGNADGCRQGELYRMKTHAEELARKAKECLLRSAPRSARNVNITSGAIGNGKVREILLQKKSKKILVAKKQIKPIEEVITESLFVSFKANFCKLTSTKVLEIMGKDLSGFDKYLTKGILKQLAVFQKNYWELRDEFKAIRQFPN